jgi:hypothetical protein
MLASISLSFINNVHSLFYHFIRLKSVKLVTILQAGLDYHKNDF